MEPDCSMEQHEEGQNDKIRPETKGPVPDLPAGC